MVPFNLELNGQGGGGAMSSPSVTGPMIQPGRAITIAPMGVNLGSILNSFGGDSASGGAGFDYDLSGMDAWSPFNVANNRVTPNRPAIAALGLSPLMMAAIAALAVGAYLVIR